MVMVMRHYEIILNKFNKCLYTRSNARSWQSNDEYKSEYSRNEVASWVPRHFLSQLSLSNSAASLDRETLGS